MKKTLEKYIRNLVPEFTNAELEEFVNLFELKTINKKEFLLKQNKYADHEIFVCSGCFHIFTIDENGDDSTLYFAIKNWWLADIDSFINRTPSTFNIQALENSEVLIINRANKTKAFAEIPKTEKLFRIMCQNLLVVYQKRIIQQNSISAEERYRYFIKRYNEIAAIIPDKLIASYIGVSPEYISRIRKIKR